MFWKSGISRAHCQVQLRKWFLNVTQSRRTKIKLSETNVCCVHQKCKRVKPIWTNDFKGENTSIDIRDYAEILKTFDFPIEAGVGFCFDIVQQWIPSVIGQNRWVYLPHFMWNRLLRWCAIQLFSPKTSAHTYALTLYWPPTLILIAIQTLSHEFVMMRLRIGTKTFSSVLYL